VTSGDTVESYGGLVRVGPSSCRPLS
jgi:hypothetical protein